MVKMMNVNTHTHTHTCRAAARNPVLLHELEKGIPSAEIN